MRTRDQKQVTQFLWLDSGEIYGETMQKKVFLKSRFRKMATLQTEIANQVISFLFPSIYLSFSFLKTETLELKNRPADFNA